MNWLNISIQTLDSENFLGSDPTERGTWLCLLRYCIGQENGGIISGCLDWSDRKWQQLVRITKKEAALRCDLWTWDGNSLIVWGYPLEKENEVREKRDRAKTNGAKGGRPIKTNVGYDEKPTLVNSAKAERKEKGKEGEREREGEGIISLPLPPAFEILPTGSAKTMLGLQERIQSVHPSYGIALTYAEQQSIMHNASCLDSLKDEDWDRLRRYMAATIPEGSAYWQPRNRSKFIESIADVHGHACAWEQKTGGAATTAKKKGFA